MMIIDEKKKNLDEEKKEWIEKKMSEYKGQVIIIKNES